MESGSAVLIEPVKGPTAAINLVAHSFCRPLLNEKSQGWHLRACARLAGSAPYWRLTVRDKAREDRADRLRKEDRVLLTGLFATLCAAIGTESAARLAAESDRLFRGRNSES